MVPEDGYYFSNGFVVTDASPTSLGSALRHFVDDVAMREQVARRGYDLFAGRSMAETLGYCVRELELRAACEPRAPAAPREAAPQQHQQQRQQQQQQQQQQRQQQQQEVVVPPQPGRL
jgi:hypothetical protein